jgi:hypothetical protein
MNILTLFLEVKLTSSHIVEKNLLILSAQNNNAKKNILHAAINVIPFQLATAASLESWELLLLEGKTVQPVDAHQIVMFMHTPMYHFQCTTTDST